MGVCPDTSTDGFTGLHFLSMCRLCVLSDALNFMCGLIAYGVCAVDCVSYAEWTVWSVGAVDCVECVCCGLCGVCAAGGHLGCTHSVLSS